MSFLREPVFFIRELWIDGCGFARRNAPEITLALGLTGLLVVLLWPQDPSFIRAISADRPEPVLDLARGIRRWGAFNDTLTFSLGMFLLGRIFRKPYWRRAGVAALMAGALAGVSVNVLRVGTGRPRPRAEEPNRFTGPSLSYKRQSFPSGHSAASFASASALAVAAPAIGVPAMLSASAVAWSSAYTRNHYVSDILAGSALGMVWGVGLGVSARRRGRSDAPAFPVTE